MRVELVDERNATEEIRFFSYRILFVDGTTHWTYTAYGARDVLEVQNWVQEQVHGRRYAIFLELPHIADPSTVALVRLSGSYFEEG